MKWMKIKNKSTMNKTQLKNLKISVLIIFQFIHRLIMEF